MMLILFIASFLPAAFGQDMFYFGELDPKTRVYYDRLFEDGKLDVTLALGFEQKKKESKIPVIGSVVDAVGNAVRGAYRDETMSRRDVFAIEQALLNCFTCGLQLHSKRPGYHVYKGEFTYRDRLIKLRVRFLYSVKGVSSRMLRGAFIDALGRDDVIAYMGHARDGRGFPDFASPLGDTGKVFAFDEVRGWTGFEKGHFARKKYQILSLNACRTKEYFHDVLRRYVWEKNPSDLGLILTDDDTWFEDYPANSAALIAALVDQYTREDLMSALEESSEEYALVHFKDKEKRLLFSADGLFEPAQGRKKAPARKTPQEPWHEMPF